ncbi:MAG TPA: hypothetical protein VFW65_32565 [Pseudonocardiaceae bacterium]|nr:hypothetical protein [Pseudonocardiaceae bacterium]
MLVALIHPAWSDEKKATIINGLKGLEKTCPEPKGSISGIASLGAGEDLWLYSHGSETTFCKMTATQLAGWLKKKGMPAGKRVITLKGCRTKDYAVKLQELLNSTTAYRAVKVEGFAGQASYTSQDGTMSIKVELTEAEKRKIALAKLTAARDLSSKGVSKPEREQQVAKVGVDTEKSLSRKEAVRDTGLGSYEALDERQARRQRRDEVRTGPETDTQPPTTTTTTTQRKPRRIIVDSAEESEMDVETDSTQTVPQPTVTPRQSTDRMDTT